MLTKTLIVGAGGHAKVVLEALLLSNPSENIVVADQAQKRVDSLLLGEHKVIRLDHKTNWPDFFHVAIGSNKVRQRLIYSGVTSGCSLVSIIHPGAIISPSAIVNSGAFVAARAVISADVFISEGCIINHGAIIDHDCNIGRFTHVAPNATVCGGVDIGEGALIGAGATILPQVEVGQGATIGAGAVIRSDVPAHGIVVGIPGKQV